MFVIGRAEAVRAVPGLTRFLFASNSALMALPCVQSPKASADAQHEECIADSTVSALLTLTYHCALLPDQSKHVFSACLYRCIARCLWGDSSDMLKYILQGKRCNLQPGPQCPQNCPSDQQTQINSPIRASSGQHAVLGGFNINTGLFWAVATSCSAFQQNPRALLLLNCCRCLDVVDSPPTLVALLLNIFHLHHRLLHGLTSPISSVTDLARSSTTMSSQKPVIALSLKARGLTVTPAIPRTRQLLLPTLGQSIVDLSIAICVQIVLLSWSAWLSVLLVILCCVFYANYQDGAMAAADGSIMIPIALLIYLPCLGLVYTVSQA